MNMPTKWSLAFMILCIGCDSSPKNTHTVQQLRFDQDCWKHSDLEVRGQMIQSIVDSGFLVGKRKVEVYTILGPPDDSVRGDFWYWYTNKNFISQPWHELLYIEMADSIDSVSAVSMSD